MCHLSVATAATKDLLLVADIVQSAHPNQANSTKTRSSKRVAKQHPSTTTGEWSGSWEPKGAQLGWVVVPQMG